MKRLLILVMAVCLLFCGCGKEEEVVEESVVEAESSENLEESSEIIEEESKEIEESEVEIIEEEKPEYVHPLNGTPMFEEWKGSAVAVIINNHPEALPHYGISQADIVYELEAEGSITRMLALFTDLEDVGSVGPVRSARTYFNSIAGSYDAPLFHCSGNRLSANGCYDYDGNRFSGWKHVDETSNSQYFFRDSDRYNYQGYAWEHTLFTTGEGIANAMTDKEYQHNNTLDFGLSFTDQPEVKGKTANEILVTFKGTKTTAFTYNASSGLYEAEQHGQVHYDAGNDQNMAYRNVLVLYVNHFQSELDGTLLSFYDLVGSGEGHWACDGKIVPIKWERDSVESYFEYTLEDGTPLTLGVGTSYIGVVSDTQVAEYN